MRTRALLISGLIALLTLSSAALPSRAAEKEVEGNLVHPVPATGPADAESHAELICAGEIPTEGTHYDWIDLEGEYKLFDVAGPPHLVSSQDAGGVMGDHDLDWYFFDAKCKNVTTHTNGPESTFKADARRPAQFVLVIYWFGVYPNLSYKLVASN